MDGWNWFSSDLELDLFLLAAVALIYFIWNAVNTVFSSDGLPKFSTLRNTYEKKIASDGRLHNYGRVTLNTDPWTSAGRENELCIATCEKRDCGTSSSRGFFDSPAFEEGL